MIEENNNMPSQDVADSERSGDRRLSTCSACDFRARVGITLLDAKWLDPACHGGCQSLAISRKLLESFREHMAAAVQLGEISEGYAQYAGDVLQAICQPHSNDIDGRLPRLVELSRCAAGC